MKIQIEIPDDLLKEFMNKMEEMSGTTWTNQAVKTYIQNFINEYIVNTIDE